MSFFCSSNQNKVAFVQFERRYQDVVSRFEQTVLPEITTNEEESLLSLALDGNSEYLTESEWLQWMIQLCQQAMVQVFVPSDREEEAEPGQESEIVETIVDKVNQITQIKRELENLGTLITKKLS